MSDRAREREIFERRKAESIPLIADSFKYHQFEDEGQQPSYGAPSHSHRHGSTRSGHRHEEVQLEPLAGSSEKRHGSRHKSRESRPETREKRQEEEVERELEFIEEIEEATPIELFYDLFFVANLTTVTSVHYITGYVSLASYVLFFSILWFTWLQVTLYDVRFAVDSVFERICRIAHFGVMAGFSSVSTNWDPLQPINAQTVSALKTMTLMLVISRAVLVVQYSVVMYFSKRQKSETIRYAKLPLGLHVVAMLLAVVSYLGLYFHFHLKSNSHAYITWFFIMLLEAVVVITTSCTFTIVSFKNTHLVERMGLLTLIILGEGIILLCKGINAIVNGFGWTSGTPGIIIASLFVIYYFWMLYFDYTPRHAHYYGTKRQQLWALLHFPYHLGIVLVLEGLRQLALYRSLSRGFSVIYRLLYPSEPLAPVESAKILNENLSYFYEEHSSETLLKNWSTITSKLYLLGNMTIKDIGTESYNETLGSLSTSLVVSVTESYGIHIKNGEEIADTNTDPWAPDGPIMAAFKLFELVYVYFFAALGVVLLMHAIFLMTVRRYKDKYDIVQETFRVIAAIVMLGMLGLDSGSKQTMHNFMASGWVIPFVAIALFVLLTVDRLFVKSVLRKTAVKVVRRTMKRRGTHGRP